MNRSVKTALVFFCPLLGWEKFLKQLCCRDFEPGEVILQDEPLLVTKDGEKVSSLLIECSVKRCAL